MTTLETKPSNKDKYPELYKKLSMARIALLQKFPFFGSLAFGMESVVSPELNPPTAATDGNTVWYHPDFIEKLKPSEMVFVMAHEIMHPAMLHTTRRGNRDPFLWNVAADYVVNQYLVDDHVGTMPEMCLFDPDLFKRCDGNTEKIYQELMKKAKGGGKGKGKSAGQPGTGKANGSSMDNCMSPQSNDPAQAAADEAKWKVKLSQAQRVAKMAGKMSANMQRFVNSVVSPKVPWRTVLNQFLVKCKDEERTWARPSRRYIPHGIYMPSADGEQMGEIAVLVDCSGSIDNETLSQFGAEITAIQQDLRPKKVHVIYFDSKVCHHDEFTPQEPVKVAPHGGGGTAFSPCFRYMEEKEITPEACVMLTDLCCSDFGPEPFYPVMFFTTMKGTAPWGTVTEMF